MWFISYESIRENEFRKKLKDLIITMKIRGEHDSFSHFNAGLHITQRYNDGENDYQIHFVKLINTE